MPNADDKRKNPTEKKPYQPPVLTKQGSLEQVTQGGNGGAAMDPPNNSS
ncbi:MAG: lasso RiPP family leader peptide-containing protein [Gammaproteobacteria bacterium]|nr:lasso RiPP family leader peptide-containing protein [Gammaproteobacteria bacterium]